MGFIKTNDHRPSNHRPTEHLPVIHRPTDHLPTDSPTTYHELTLKQRPDSKHVLIPKFMKTFVIIYFLNKQIII